MHINFGDDHVVQTSVRVETTYRQELRSAFYWLQNQNARCQRFSRRTHRTTAKTISRSTKGTVGMLSRKQCRLQHLLPRTQNKTSTTHDNDTGPPPPLGAASQVFQEAAWHCGAKRIQPQTPTQLRLYNPYTNLHRRPRSTDG
eukprot:5274039-Amphidinium_carterae.1